MNVFRSIKTRANMFVNKSLANAQSFVKEYLSKKKPEAELAEYRRKIKVYDVFNFFNELEVLEIRLNILDPYVDYFVIVESPLTHSGQPKELFFQKNKDLFKKFEHKIIHYVITEPLQSFADAGNRLLRNDISDLEREILTNALNSDSAPEGLAHFLRDFYEKESIKKALVGLSDNDFCYISDLDEIWNPEALIDYSTDDVYKFKQLAYYYYLNNRSSEPWVGTTATKYKNIKNACVNDLKSIAKTRHTFVKNGGWHFTYQGGMERVQKKIESFSHQEFNTDSTKSKIADRFTENKDVVGRNFKFWIDETNLPNYIRENKQKYIRFFKQ